MSTRRYKGYSLRNKIFWGFLVVCFLSILGSTVLSFIILRNNAIEQSKIDQLKKSEALMASLDYAVSKQEVTTSELPEVLGNEIYEIADINKHDVIIYDLNGNYLLSNKEPNLIEQKKISKTIIDKVLRKDSRIDVEDYDDEIDANVISSYMILKNNMLEPIAIVFFPYYHSDSAYLDVLNRYLKYVAIVNLFVIAFSIWLSWIISSNLTNALTRFSDMITRITLFDKEMRPIKYYRKDELSPLVIAYNKMILQIQDQKERLSITEREQAWREMAKQIAHEVKNPLTPMKLSIQNFERKFDVNDPDILKHVKKLSSSMLEQIDMIATVATAFSQFAQLPEKNDEVFELNEEVNNVLGVFSDDNIFVHTNKNQINVKMDRVYLNRIITNLVTNARQAASEQREPMINVDLEKNNKRINISVEDNGIGIPEDMYERIFEPNFTSKNSGMGLGLTMVRKMVEEYGGEISVNSVVGKGSKFSITLPTNL